VEVAEADKDKDTVGVCNDNSGRRVNDRILVSESRRISNVRLGEHKDFHASVHWLMGKNDSVKERSNLVMLVRRIRPASAVVSFASYVISRKMANNTHSATSSSVVLFATVAADDTRVDS
jgi:hypothetical protein